MKGNQIKNKQCLIQCHLLNWTMTKQRKKIWTTLRWQPKNSWNQNVYHLKIWTNQQMIKKIPTEIEQTQVTKWEKKWNVAKKMVEWKLHLKPGNVLSIRWISLLFFCLLNVYRLQLSKLQHKEKCYCLFAYYSLTLFYFDFVLFANDASHFEIIPWLYLSAFFSFGYSRFVWIHNV